MMNPIYTTLNGPQVSTPAFCTHCGRYMELPILCSMPNHEDMPFCSNTCFEATSTSTSSNEQQERGTIVASSSMAMEIEDDMMVVMGGQKQLDLSRISDDVMDYVLLPMLDAKVSHYLKCTNKTWYEKLSAQWIKGLPKFQMIQDINSSYLYDPSSMTVGSDSKIYITRTGEDAFCLDLESKSKTQVAVDKDGKSMMPIDCAFCIGGIVFNSKNEMVVAGGGYRPVLFTYSPDNNKRLVNWAYTVDDYFDRMLRAYNRAILSPEDFLNAQEWTTEASHTIQVSNDEQSFTVITSQRNPNGSQNTNNCVFPDFPTVGLDDDILVVDSERQYVQVFDRHGKWKRSIGAYPNTRGHLRDATSITVSKVDGRIFVADAGTEFFDMKEGSNLEDAPCIKVYNYNGHFLFDVRCRQGTNEPYFERPCSIALSKCEKYLLVLDSGNEEIQVFNSMNGKLLLIFKHNRTLDGETLLPKDIHIGQKVMRIPGIMSVHPKTGHIYVTTITKGKIRRLNRNVPFGSLLIYK
jgi:hypothetical protein